MNNLTLPPKSGSGGLIWRALLPFLALFAVLGTSQSVLAQASFIEPNTVSFNIAPTGGTSTTTSYTNRGTATTTFPAYQDADLGKGASFDQATGSLTLSSLRVPIDYDNVGSPGTPPDPTDPADPGIPATPATVINSVVLKYRVYLAGTTTSSLATLAYTNVSLNLTSSSGRTAIYRYTGAPINILNQSTVLGGGTYTVQLLIVANYTKGSSTQDVSDPGTTEGRTATFKVIPPAVTPNGGLTTWISNSSSATGIDWLNKDNWSNGVPTRFSDAVLPAKMSVNPTSTPLLSDPNAIYEVRTLTLNGTTNSTRALLRVGQSIPDPNTGNTSPVGATLRVYGDLNNYSGGILGSVSGTNGTADPQRNSTIVLARADGGFQVVRGALDIIDIRIEGTGIKAVINEINAANTFAFATDPTGPGAIVQTSNDDGAKDPSTGLTITSPSLAADNLNTTKTVKVNLKDSGYLVGETKTSYVRGITVADRPLLANVKQTFGNIGIDITPNRDIPSPNVNITRTVGDPLFGPLGNSSSAPAGSPQPVKRQYGVSGDVNNNTVSTITFHYLNSADELNGNPEANLTIFKTANNAPPYSLIGRTTAVLGGATGEGTVTRVGYSGTINTVTLGDQNNPLPVKLTAFNAVRNAANALITWTTASEQDNKGFEVQVSTDGSTFRTLGFVASAAANTTQTQRYSYTDVENGKFGIRYYRLHQVDIDGSGSYSPTRALSFDGISSSASALVAYPNPFTDADKVVLNFDGSTGNGVAQVKLIDSVGRTVFDQNMDLTNASLSLDNLASLRSGMYLARITLPGGATQSVRIQKR